MMTTISEVVNTAATALDADFVFYDAGPNIGPLNRALVLDCDFLVVPASCDLFSARALKTLGQSIKSWIRDWRTVEMIAPDDVALLSGRPKLIGYIPQRFRVYGGNIASNQARYLAMIEKQLHADVVQVIREFDPELAPYSVSQMKLGQVQDFGTLVAASQRQGVPIWEVDAGTPLQRKNAKTIFEGVAAKLLEKMEPAS
jgi:cellulose biosynthesis protein BcsQ